MKLWKGLQQGSDEIYDALNKEIKENKRKYKRKIKEKKRKRKREKKEKSAWLLHGKWNWMQH